jgi:hypothetical protein
MGIPTPEVGYVIATTRRETMKVHKNMWWQWGAKEKKKFYKLHYDTILVKCAYADASFYTNNSKMPNFEL